MDDLISRQAAIDAIFSEPLYESGMKKRDADVVVPAIYEKIKALPSAQLDPEEFEWCHDCKEYDQDSHCCHRWTKVIRQTVEELREGQTEAHWIPCSERMPDPFVKVLVSDVDGDVGIAWFEDIFSEWWSDRYGLIEVLVWMPLPEPYQEEEPECANGCLYGWHSIECEHCTLKGKQRGRAKDDTTRD